MATHPNRSTKQKKPSATPSPEEVRAARELAQLTQKEAADLIHCTESGWQKWELGERRMHPAFWDLFGRVLEERQAG
jgi:DNA-binding transcriptional regulator YiaG